MTNQVKQTIPKGYKQTEIGAIPEDWGVEQLKDVVSKVIDNRGKTPPYSNNPDIELIETASISFVVQHPNYSKVTKFVSKKTYENWFRGHPIKNDILISTVGEYSGSSAVMEENRGTIAQNLIAMRIKNADPMYVFYWTRSKSFEEQLNQVMMSQAQPSLRVPWLLSFYLNIPRPDEQSAIVAILSDLDELTESMEKLIAKKRAIKQGAMQGLLTGRRRLPGFNEEWKTTRLGEVAEIIKGRGLSKSKLSLSGKYPCILYGELFTTYTESIEIVYSKTENAEGVQSKCGDVLIPGSTTTTGIDLAKASALLIDNVLLGGDINIIRQLGKYYNPLFLAYSLTHVYKYDIAQKTKGITIHHLHGNDLLGLEIKMPDEPEQMAIASILSDMQTEIEALEKALSKYKMIKNGMMQNLLTGKIRVYGTHN